MLSGVVGGAGSLTRRALIVDDSSGMRAHLRAILTAAGCVCQEAANGIDAFEHIMGERFDLVVTDLHMPEMNGFQLLAAISLLRRTKRPPVIVVSANIDADIASRRPELRIASALLDKPIHLQEFLKAVDAAIWTPPDAFAPGDA